MKIYKVYFSERDSLNLAGREAPKVIKAEMDFMKLVVKKPWGYEYLMIDNPFSQVWSLFIKHECLTSTHAHPNKKTALILISGEAQFSTQNTSIYLKPQDSVMIDPAVFHTTKALSKEGARVLEVETPPLKYDLIRVKDRYGREGKFYEGLDQMYANENDCVRFNGKDQADFVQKTFFNTILSIKKIKTSYSKEDILQIMGHDFLVLLEGKVHSKKGHLLYSVSDVIKCSDFLHHLDSHVINNVTLLLLKLQN